MARCRRVLLYVELLVILVLLASFDCATARRKKKSMKDIDWDALEKEWEKGDDEEELLTDKKLKMKKLEAARNKQPKFDPNNPQDFLKNGGGQPQAGPVMLFADLHKTSPLLGELTDNKVEDLLKGWKDKLLTGGVKSQVYNIQDGKILVSVDGAADSFDVKDFLLEQPEVDFVTLNSQKYSRPGKGADL